MRGAPFGVAGSLCARAYPRRCGEHEGAFLHGVTYVGLTPAGAGSTSSPFRAAMPVGLPPQVRGAPVLRTRSPQDGHGLTPAGAGSTVRKRSPPTRCTLSTLVGLPPQVRGARAPSEVRSHRRCGGDNTVHTWLTPAGAGSTRPSLRQSLRVSWGLPPQVRGALDRYALTTTCRGGLPPQVRGARNA